MTRLIILLASVLAMALPQISTAMVSADKSQDLSERRGNGRMGNRGPGRRGPRRPRGRAIVCSTSTNNGRFSGYSRGRRFNRPEVRHRAVRQCARQVRRTLRHRRRPMRIRRLVRQCRQNAYCRPARGHRRF